MENKLSNIKERCLLIAEYKSISKELFFSKIGTTYGNFKGSNKKTPLNSTVIANILTLFPDLNPTWLITGEGKMLKVEESLPVINYNSQGNPYYNVDFTGSFNLMYNDQSVIPEYFINFEPFNIKNGMWCNIAGKSMEPEINNGDKICIKEVKDWQTFMPYGEIYGIVTDEFRTVKRVGKSERDGCVKLIPSNPAYDPQDLPICKIIAVFQVVGAVKMF